MKVLDISMEIHKEMAVYRNKDEKRPHIQTMQDHKGGTVHESRIGMDLHTGTHIDAPLHMVKGGETMESYPVEKFVTNCKVLDMTEVAEHITKEDLKSHDIQPGDFILLKTRNSFVEEFDPNFVFVEKTGASYLAEIGISGVGIDSLGIERSQPGHETHITLLAAGIAILEGLRLRDITPGAYFLVAPPVKIRQVEAAPTRALLIQF